MSDSLYCKIDDFFNENQDLIDEYESIDGMIPLEYCVEDIIKSYKKLYTIDKETTLQKSLTAALQKSIKHNINILDAYDAVINDTSNESDVSNVTQQYFKDVNTVYTKYNNDYNIEYKEENRDKLIEMNLKSVISIAKKYQGLGLTLQELISAGNLGLVTAWDKFDPNRSKLKDNIIASIEDLPDEFTYDDLMIRVNEYLSYGDIKKKLLDRFKEGHTYTKKELIKWINGNIFNAKFNSIATMWIRAFILIEIDNNSRVVKKPKSEIHKDKIKYGSYKKEVTMDIDATVNDSSGTRFSDMLRDEEETYSDLEVAEAYNIYKKGLNKLLEGVKSRDRTIFLKRYGIGLPRPMLPKEIADQEGISIARISQILQVVLKQIQHNQVKYGIDGAAMFDAVKKFK